MPRTKINFRKVCKFKSENNSALLRQGLNVGVCLRPRVLCFFIHSLRKSGCHRAPGWHCRCPHTRSAEGNDQCIWQRWVFRFRCMLSRYSFHWLITVFNSKAFICFEDIHDARPHKGQKMVARKMRSLLHSDTYQSEIAGLFFCKLLILMQTVPLRNYHTILFLHCLHCSKSPILRQSAGCLHCAVHSTGNSKLTQCQFQQNNAIGTSSEKSFLLIFRSPLLSWHEDAVLSDASLKSLQAALLNKWRWGKNHPVQIQFSTLSEIWDSILLNQCLPPELLSFFSCVPTQQKETHKCQLCQRGRQHQHSFWHEMFRNSATTETRSKKRQILWCLQVHGIVNDTVEFVRSVLITEINSATDNPVSFQKVLHWGQWIIPDDKMDLCVDNTKVNKISVRCLKCNHKTLLLIFGSFQNNRRRFESLRLSTDGLCRQRRNFIWWKLPRRISRKGQQGNPALYDVQLIGFSQQTHLNTTELLSTFLFFSFLQPRYKFKNVYFWRLDDQFSHRFWTT